MPTTNTTDDVDAVLEDLRDLSLSAKTDPKETLHDALDSCSMIPAKERVRFVLWHLKDARNIYMDLDKRDSKIYSCTCVGL